MFFCRKLPSTQKVATSTAVKKKDFHPLQKNQRVKYPAGLEDSSVNYSLQPTVPANQGRLLLRNPLFISPLRKAQMVGCSCLRAPTTRLLAICFHWPRDHTASPLPASQTHSSGTQLTATSLLQAMRPLGLLLTPPPQLGTTLLWRSWNAATKKLDY